MEGVSEERGRKKILAAGWGEGRRRRRKRKLIIRRLRAVKVDLAGREREERE